MTPPHRIVRVAALLLALTGCGVAPSQLQGTATVLGCWPYGYDLPAPTKTAVIMPVATSAAGTPTPIVTSTPTPAPTYPPCTPAPLTPTVTASPTPSPTPWTWPTALPGVISGAAPVNLSHQPGIDAEPAIAVHADGWAAVVWANWLPEDPDHATVWVRVQDPQTRAWKRAQGVNTGPVTKAAGSPAIAIDAAGRIHVLFTQDRRAVITTSLDAGTTWTDPEPLPLGRPGFGYQLSIDASGMLHALVGQADACFDCFHYLHAARPSGGGAWSVDDAIAPGAKQLHGALTTVQRGGQVRMIAAISCNEGSIGCTPGPMVVTQDGLNGGWRERTIPNVDARLSPQVVDWLSLTSDGAELACVSWGQYSRSGVFASCSHDGGSTWEDAGVIAYHDPSGEGPAPTAAPEATAAPAPSLDDEDRAFHPELLFDPASHRLLAVWRLREPPAPGGQAAFSLVWSWREAAPNAVWWPLIDGGTQEPPLALFDATRRSAADAPRLAYAGHGLAWVAWQEVERDESIEIYVGAFTPAALLQEAGQ